MCVCGGGAGGGTLKSLLGHKACGMNLTKSASYKYFNGIFKMGKILYNGKNPMRDFGRRTECKCCKINTNLGYEQALFGYQVFGFSCRAEKAANELQGQILL